MSIEHTAMDAPDPVAVLEPENTDRETAWVVASVYVDYDADHYNNLLTCGLVCRTFGMAKAAALEKARVILDEYNANERYNGRPELAFSDAWMEIDRFDGLEREYGFDPTDAKVSCSRIRAFEADSLLALKGGRDGE